MSTSPSRGRSSSVQATTRMFAGGDHFRLCRLSGSEYKYVGTDESAATQHALLGALHEPIRLPAGKLMWDVGFNWTSAGSRELLSVPTGIYTLPCVGIFWTELVVPHNGQRPFRRRRVTSAPSCRAATGSLNADDRYVRLSVTYKFGKSKHQYQSKSGSSTKSANAMMRLVSLSTGNPPMDCGSAACCVQRFLEQVARCYICRNRRCGVAEYRFSSL